MSGRLWLEPGDELLLDGVDYRVIERLMARTPRLSVQRLSLRPQLGGEDRALLQFEETLMEAEALPPDLLEGEQVQFGERTFHLRWEDQAHVERDRYGAAAKFGRGRFRWYTATDVAVAALISNADMQSAILGTPLASGRIDLRFTEGLRRTSRG